MTLAELIAAYRTGILTEPLTLDNDATFVYVPQGDPDDPAVEWTKVFDMHPEKLLRELLDHLCIPHEGV